MKNTQKGISSVVSFVLVVVIAMMAISIVLTTSRNTIDSATGTTSLKDAENVLKIIDNAASEVATEGNGSSRIIEISTVGSFTVLPDEDAIEFQAQGSGFEYLSRVFVKNTAYISGNDVSCGTQDADADGQADLVLENTFIKAAFQMVSNNGTQLNTSNNILLITEKKSGSTVTFSDSSVLIDKDPLTSNGTGYSRVLKEGTQLPMCVAYFFVNSTVDYDVFYRLYAGADFITAEVRIR